MYHWVVPQLLEIELPDFCHQVGLMMSTIHYIKGLPQLKAAIKTRCALLNAVRPVAEQSVSDGLNKGTSLLGKLKLVQPTIFYRKVGGGALIGTRCYVVNMSSFGFV